VAVAAECFGGRSRAFDSLRGVFCTMNIELLPDDWSRVFRHS
jgi:hypothetical protein